MSRSLKKGPFIDFKLAKKVAALANDDRTIIKPGPALRPFLRNSSVAPSLSTMAKCTCRYS